jgi:GPN-loop GTPase
MLQMDLPHLNVLTKIDNLSNYPPLLFNLDFYTEVHDLQYLLPHLDAERDPTAAPPPSDDTPSAPHDDASDTAEPPPSKFAALNHAIVELVQDFGLVSFETLAVEDKASVTNLLRVIDRASGYAFGASDAGANDSVWQVAMRDGYTTMDVRDVQERWVDRKDEFDERERAAWEDEARRFNEGPAGDGEGGPMEGVQSTGEEMDLPNVRRGMMGRDVSGGVSVVRKPPPDVQSSRPK